MSLDEALRVEGVLPKPQEAQPLSSFLLHLNAFEKLPQPALLPHKPVEGLKDLSEEVGSGLLARLRVENYSLTTPLRMPPQTRKNRVLSK